jgi:hypothetical protein
MRLLIKRLISRAFKAKKKLNPQTFAFSYSSLSATPVFSGDFHLNVELESRHQNSSSPTWMNMELTYPP